MPLALQSAEREDVSRVTPIFQIERTAHWDFLRVKNEQNSKEWAVGACSLTLSRLGWWRPAYSCTPRFQPTTKAWPLEASAALLLVNAVRDAAASCARRK
eukprot:7075614-Prymnesium_polylepis.1